MKAAEIRRISEEEMKQRLRDSSDELFRLKFQLLSGQLQNHRRMRSIKRDIARMKTIAREIELKNEQSNI
jgi:large subunit ribosomal protein L29